MKIAIFHELTLGGARRVANEQAFYLSKNHEVDIYYIDKQFNKDEKKYSKIYYHKFLLKDWKGGNWKVKLYKDSIELVKLYFFHKKIAKIIDSKNYDFVIVHPSKITQSPFILRFLKTKNLYYAEEVYRIMYEPVHRFRKSEYPLKYIYETLTKFVKKTIDQQNTKKAKLIVASSKNTVEGFKKFYNRKVQLCYPGVDIKFFNPKKVKREIDILFVGSLDYETDEYTLFKTTMHFVKSDLKIKVLGDLGSWITDEEIRDYYRKSKLVFCSSGNEPLGLVPLEAGACGTPTLAVSSGGYKETIKHLETGLLFKRNPIFLASMIDKYINDSRFLDKLGKNSRIFVEKEWSWNNRIIKLEEIIEKYLNPLSYK